MTQTQQDLMNRVFEEARLYIDNRATVRQVSTLVQVSKSTVHNDLTKRLPNYIYDLSLKSEDRTKAAQLNVDVNSIIDINTAQRCYRGGFATAKKRLECRKQA